MKPPRNVSELESALRRIGGTDENGYRLRCKRLFANRKRQAWPSFISVTDTLRPKYDYSRSNMDVLPDVNQAITAINDFIQEIAQNS